MAMDSDTLQTASTYLNNLLLARGLLRNGSPLDFAKPTRDTRAQIINLVHDLLLRRDREQDSREKIALTVRALHADQTRKDAEIEKLHNRATEKERNLLQTQTDNRNLKAEVKKLELSARALQDQLAKMKASVAQIKTQCSSDVKKRDLHIERLKTHLQGQQRGNKGSVVAPSITVTGGTGSGRGRLAFNASVRDLQDPEYSLKQETNEFLTQLSQSLSDENDGLIAMIRSALHDMKQLLGPSDTTHNLYDSTIGGSGASNQAGQGQSTDALPLSYESLATELESTMAVLKTVLTSPNFVSMDEVEIRDEEIAGLREGWVMMESRWRELLLMMQGWRNRLEKTGDTINLDDLKRGLGLGVGLEVPPSARARRVTASPGRYTDSAAVYNDAGIYGDDDSSIDESSLHDSAQQQSTHKVISHGDLEPPEFFNLKPSTKDRTLQGLNLNVQSPRRVAFNLDSLENTDPSIVQTDALKDDPSKLQTPTVVKTAGRSTSSRRQLSDSALRDREPKRSSSKRRHSPLGTSAEHGARQSAVEPDHASSSMMEEGCPQLTVEEKLRVVQAEAEAAAAAPIDGTQESDSQIDFAIDEEISKSRSPAKKSMIQGRPKRRKSTLSPEELATLLAIE
ncbi:hypothetical protein MBLNU459_g6681t1 [Dothideomycetes sp. NU459]